MRKLLNTLYINSNGYLNLQGANIVINTEEQKKTMVPLHNLEAIYCFGHVSVSDGLMTECGKNGISLCFFWPSGRLKARTVGFSTGNILLRHEQFLLLQDKEKSLNLARNIIFAKVYNQKWVIERTVRDHYYNVDSERLKAVSKQLSEDGKKIKKAESLETLRGIKLEPVLRTVC